MSCKSKKSAAKTQAVTASPAPAPEKAPVVPATSAVEQASRIPAEARANAAPSTAAAMSGDSPAKKKGNGKAATPKGAEPHPLRQLVEAAILAGKSTSLSSACQAIGVPMKGDVEERKARLQAWLDGKPVVTVEPASSPAGKPADAKPTTEKPAPKAKTERAPRTTKKDGMIAVCRHLYLVGAADPAKSVSEKDLVATLKAAGLGNPVNRIYECRHPEKFATDVEGAGKDPLIAKPKMEGVDGQARYLTDAGVAFLKLHAPELFTVPTPAEKTKTKTKTAKTK